VARQSTPKPTVGDPATAKQLEVIRRNRLVTSPDKLASLTKGEAAKIIGGFLSRVRRYYGNQTTS
jgi:hypothetical protein